MSISRENFLRVFLTTLMVSVVVYIHCLIKRIEGVKKGQLKKMLGIQENIQVTMYVVPNHPLLKLKAVLPWDTLTEIMKKY